jgi:transposase
MPTCWSRESQDYQIDLFGPTRDDCQWQAHEARGFDAQHFVMDWQQQVATCPEGHRSNSWSPSVDTRGNEVIRIKFSQKDCGSCPSRIYCTRTTSAYPRRMISVRPQKQYQAFQAARERETTEGFPKQYALRAGIEGTISQSVRAFGGRRSRYCGLAKTHLQHLLIATGINLLRTDMWLTETPCAKTRHSAFVQLYQAAA